MGGHAASGTHAHQLLFHLAKAGPRQVGGMHAGQAQGRNCPQMRRGVRVGLIWEEEEEAGSRSWEEEAWGDRPGREEVEGSAAKWGSSSRKLPPEEAPGDPLPRACEAGSRGEQTFSPRGPGPAA